MKKIIINILFLFVATNVFPQATELFISEYIEGTGTNQAIEIFNGTGGTVDLSAYTLKIDNGQNEFPHTVSLSGNLDDGDVYVITFSDAATAIKNEADKFISTDYRFDGNDMILLQKNGTTIDKFGKWDPEDVNKKYLKINTSNSIQHNYVNANTVILSFYYSGASPTISGNYESKTYLGAGSDNDYGLTYQSYSIVYDAAESPKTISITSHDAKIDDVKLEKESDNSVIAYTNFETTDKDGFIYENADVLTYDYTEVNKIIAKDFVLTRKANISQPNPTDSDPLKDGNWNKLSPDDFNYIGAHEFTNYGPYIVDIGEDFTDLNEAVFSYPGNYTSFTYDGNGTTGGEGLVVAYNEVTLTPGFWAKAGSNVTIGINSNNEGPEVEIAKLSETSIAANASGGIGDYSYRWSNGSTSRTLSSITPGTYAVTVTDEINNFGTAEYILYNESINLDASKNYIYSITPTIKHTGEQSIESLKVTEKHSAVTYFDGLGRDIQQIGIKASPKGLDVVQHIEYDEYGRQAKSYLPYTANNLGDFDSNPITDLNTFYNPLMFGNDAPYYYAETEFDNSPLNRVMKQGSPGEDWQLNANPVEYNYRANTENEVRIITVAGSLPRSDAYYDIGELFVNEVYDENGNKTEEFKNKHGQVILKRTYDGAVEHSTYYVYDDFGLLCFVIPPKVTVGSGTIAYPELVYEYQYDERKRMIGKKIPGADWVYMVYNKNDQLVLSQDGNMRNGNKWLFTKYDHYGRIIMTGLIPDVRDRATIQTTINDDIVIYESPKAYISDADYEEKFGYTNNAFPSVVNAKVYTVNYYDDYDFGDGFAYDPFTETNFDSPELLRTKGFLTGSLVNQSGSLTITANDTHLQTISFYDKYGRIIQTISQNHHEGEDVIFTKYDFEGKVLNTKQTHFVGTSEVVTLKENYTYDHEGRLLNTYHQLNDNPAVVLSGQKYNEIGQLASKGLHSENNGSSYKQTMKYMYNIRGWLSQINNPYDVSSTDYFALKLLYNNATEFGTEVEVPAQFNGNISEMVWKTVNHQSTVKTKGYGFTYDGLNRLTSSDYAIYSGAWSDEPGNSLESVSYDKNGNIESLVRSDEGTFIDQLQYTYKHSGLSNQLHSVSDISGNAAGFTEGVSSNTYDYDVNGNMIVDNNKGITNADAYNYMNLPQDITTTNGDISYDYDAIGNKLSFTGTNGKQRDYIHNFVYDDGNLIHILTSEGLINYSSDSYQYEYYLKDHLGNIRVTFTKNGPDQTTDYYPFGMRIGESSDEASSTNRYLYNGKEIQEELDWYDYGARMYDAEIGRWHCIDPLAETYNSWSPYHYALNNPIRYTDFMGMGAEEEGKEEEEKQQQKSKEITEDDINKIADDLPEDYTTGDVINAVVGALGDNENAFVKGSTIKKLGNQKAEEAKKDLDPNNPEDKKTIDQIDQGVADGNKVLNQIDKIEKTGNEITIKPAVKDKTIVVEGTINVNIKPDNKITIVSATSSKVQLEMQGISTVAGKIKRATITPQAATVKVGVLPEKTFEF